jgi:hypothetical protein
MAWTSKSAAYNHAHREFRSCHPKAISLEEKPMKTPTVLGTLLLSALIIGAGAATTFAITYTTLDDPAAAPGYTFAQGISGGNIVGWYDDASGGAHGFLYNGSTYTTLDDPLAQTSGFTEPRAISGGNIVGDYYDNSGFYHAFLYDGSTYATLNIPGPVGISGGNIINNAYAYHFDGSIYATLNDPLAGPQGTYASGVFGGNIVGYYLDSSNFGHGFLYDGSTFRTLDYPLGAIATTALGISGSNIVGFYYDSSDAAHAYLYNGSSYATLDDPPGTFLTVFLAIDGNTIVGTYYDELGYHGFVATVPEPSSIVIAALGFLGLFVFVRRRKPTLGTPRLSTVLVKREYAWNQK